MKKLTLLVINLLLMSELLAQSTYSIKGIVRDSSGQQLIGASILLIAANDSFHTVSNTNGSFIFNNIPQSTFAIKINLLGYKQWIQEYKYSNLSSIINIPPIILVSSPQYLKEVVIMAQSPMVKLKEDTIEYKISNYHMRENAVVEDLLKRLPGLSVDENGNVKFMGHDISKIRINGHDYPVRNIRDITRLFPTNIIEKIQIVDDYGDMANVTGRKLGIPDQILNLELKSTTENTFKTKLIAGLGNNNRYNASLFSTLMKKKEQFLLTVNSNNTDDNVGKFSMNNGSFTYNRNRKYLNSEVTINGSNVEKTQESNSIINTTTNEGVLNANNLTIQQQKSEDYSFYTKQEYNTEKKGKFILSLKGQLSKQNTNSTTQSIQTGLQMLNQEIVNDNPTKSSGLNGSIFLSQPFREEKTILTISFNSNIGWNNNTLDNYNQLQYFTNDTIQKDSTYHQLIDKDNRIINYSPQFSWVEKINQNTSTELNYGLKITKQSNNQNTFTLENEKAQLIDSLSNKYSYNTTLQYIIYNIKRSWKKTDLIIGLSPRIWRLQSIPNNTNTSNINGKMFAPIFYFNYKLNKNSNLKLSYNNIIYLPNYQQVQTIPDRTNIQSPIYGNPNLKAPTNNSFNVEYKQIGMVLFLLNANANFLKNKINTNTILVKDTFNTVIQDIHLINTNGDYSTGISYNISKQNSSGKFQVSFEGDDQYNYNILYMDNARKSTKSISFRHALKPSIFYSWIELTGNIEYKYNRNIYLLEENTITNLQTWNLQVFGNFYFLKTWNLNFDARKQFNNISGNASANPFIIGARLEKSFNKNMFVMRLQGFNLLDQVSNFSQYVNANTISYTKNNLTGRFLLLSAILNIKN